MSLFLSTGEITADFQTLGKLPSYKDALNIVARYDEKASDERRSMREVLPSSLWLGFFGRSDMALLTSDTVMFIN